MNAQDVMSRDVVTVTPDATILHAVRLMLQRKFSGLPVVDAAGTLVGIVTEGDFLRRIETETLRCRPRWIEFLIGPGPLAAEYTHSSGRIVGEVMTRDVLTVTEDAPLEAIVNLMERHQVKRLPVVRGKEIVGIVTRQNLLRALVDRTSAGDVAAGDDNDIRERLLGELKAQPWAPLIDAFVERGRVRLVGTILDERQRAAIHVAAENVPGVKSIEDQLFLIEPMSGVVVGPRAA
jgi:CBS domain-containing protein